VCTDAQLPVERPASIASSHERLAGCVLGWTSQREDVSRRRARAVGGECDGTSRSAAAGPNVLLPVLA